MTLNRQLWYVLVAVVLISFCTSFIVTSISSVRFIEQQLTTENTNSANMLAQTLGDSSKEPAMLELIVSAQFDTGFYQSITLTDNQGNIIVERSFQGASTNQVPQWFADWFEPTVPAGEALVQDGWTSFGKVLVKSQNTHALEALWSRYIVLLVIALCTAVLAGLCGTVLLRSVTRPLNHVVQQAESISQGQYALNKTLPKTRDLRKLVEAMNKMTDKVRQQFQSDLQKLSSLQASLYIDADTALYNRRFILERLHTHVTRETEGLPAYMVLLHLDALTELNKNYGRKNVDNYIQSAAQLISEQAKQLELELGCKIITARLNASDFGLLIENAADTRLLENALESSLSAITHYQTDPLNRSATWYATIETTQETASIGQLMMRLDDHITHAKVHPDNDTLRIQSATQASSRLLFDDKQSWSDAFTDALNQGSLQIDYNPVVSQDGTRLHVEAAPFFEAHGRTLRYDQFYPWAKRLGFISDIQLFTIRHALEYSAAEGSAVAIHLSIDFLKSVNSRAALIKDIQRFNKSGQAANVLFEITEFEIKNQQKLFADFCFSVKRLGCQIGLTGCSNSYEYMHDMEAFGLDYLKVERAIIQSIPKEPAEIEHSLPAKLCQLGHSLDMRMYADGLKDAADIDRAFTAGFDGYSKLN